MIAPAVSVTTSSASSSRNRVTSVKGRKMANTIARQTHSHL